MKFLKITSVLLSSVVVACYVINLLNYTRESKVVGLLIIALASIWAKRIWDKKRYSAPGLYAGALLLIFISSCKKEDDLNRDKFPDGYPIGYLLQFKNNQNTVEKFKIPLKVIGVISGSQKKKYFEYALTDADGRYNTAYSINLEPWLSH